MVFPKNMIVVPVRAPALPRLRNVPGQHTVMIRTDLLENGKLPVPYPRSFQDVWDDDNIQMPCSEKSLIMVLDEKSGDMRRQGRWPLIQKMLREKFTNSEKVKNAILKYNPTNAMQIWDFTAWDTYCNDVLQPGEEDHLLDVLLPNMVELALRIPELCTKPIPFLKKGMNHSITLSQEQVACLLANAFFCTFPNRTFTKGEYATYPDINFFKVFEGASPKKIEKLRALMCYFRTVTENMPTGLITFQRKTLAEPPVWKHSDSMFSKLHICCKGTIEDGGQGMLMVDFANKFVGGDILGSGLVQEEIRFLINPELIVARLFTESLDQDECLIITGSQRYSKHQGFASSFEWVSSYNDTTPRDSWQRRCTEIVAIDAIPFRTFMEQFHLTRITRELNKAYCGFARPGVNNLPPVATGSWGCGAFGGDARLKALVQILAASEAGRDLAYFTFGDSKLMTDIHALHTFIAERNITIGEVYNLLDKYYTHVCVTCPSKRPVSLYTFIYQECSPSLRRGLGELARSPFCLGRAVYRPDSPKN